LHSSHWQTHRWFDLVLLEQSPQLSGCCAVRRPAV